MARVKNTPNINTGGLFVVSSPFKVKRNTDYRVIALRNYTEMLADYIDIYKDFYEPKGIGEDLYNQDAAIDATMVTLASEHGEILHIPDTYITKFPDNNVADFVHVVASISLGPLPRNTNLSHLKQSLSQVTSSVIGKEPTVRIHTGPVSKSLSIEEGNAVEKSRKALVTNRQTAYMKATKLESTITALQVHIKKLEQEITRLKG